MGDPLSPYSEADARAASTGTPAAAPPGPGFLGSIGPGYRAAKAGPDWGWNQINYEARITDALLAEATKRGWRPPVHQPPPGTLYTGGEDFGAGVARQTDQLISWYQEARRRDPRLLPDYAGVIDRATLRAHAIAQRQRDLGQAEFELRGGSTAGELIGGLGAGFTDPTSYIPVGGPAIRAGSFARAVLGIGLREFGANVALSTALEPATRADARMLGVERTTADSARDILTAGAGGFVIGGTLGAAGHGLPLLLDRFDRAVPQEVRTPTETAAVHVLEREQEVRQASPHEPGPAGDDAHWRRLDAALEADGPPRDVPRVAASGTRVVQEDFMRRVRGAESSGSDSAKNELSTASGRYGFTMSTWNRYFRSIYRDTKLSSNEIWAKRFDGNLQDVMMRALTADNAHRLRAAGLPETTGNLYLLHFAGPDGLKVLHAAPETPLERLLPPRDFAANPFLKGKTAGELIGWADRRMGGRGEARPPRGGEPAAEPAAEAAPAAEEEPWPELREEPRDFAPDEALHASEDMPVLRPELFGTPEEHARAQMAVWREAGLADPSGAVDAPAPGPSIEMRGRAAMDRSGPVDVMQAVADAGGLLDNEGHDLAKGRGIPAFVKGAGVIIRKAGDPRGRSVDAVGEHLWEQGYFGPPETTPRPREAEVLDLVDRAVREKVYKPEEAAAAAERKARRSAPSEADALDELRAVAREGGVDLDPATLHTALMHRAAGESPEGAVARAVQEAAFRELGPPAELARFDDPDGEGVQAQIDSLDHDLRMALEAGAAGEAYRLNDAGEPMTIEEMFEALDEDDRTNAVLRGCMAPTAMAAE